MTNKTSAVPTKKEEDPDINEGEAKRNKLKKKTDLFNHNQPSLESTSEKKSNFSITEKINFSQKGEIFDVRNINASFIEIKLNIRSYFPHYEDIFHLINNFYNLNNKVDNSNKILDNDKNNNDFINQKKNLTSFPIQHTILLNTSHSHQLENFLYLISKNIKIELFKININIKHSEILKNLPQLRGSIKETTISLDSDKFKVIYLDLCEIEYEIDILKSNNLYNFEYFFQILTTINQIIHDFSDQVKTDKNYLFILIRDKNTKYFFQNSLDVDINLTFSFPNQKSRINYIQDILNQIFPKNDLINAENLSQHLDEWQFSSIYTLLKNIYNYINLIETGRNQKVKVTTEYIINLLNSDKFDSLKPEQFKRKDVLQNFKNEIQYKHKSLNIEEASHNKNFIDQLYQEAASENFQDLSIILDKILKGIILEDYERELLADYPFLLKKTPQEAIEKLNKAKAIIERLNTVKQ